MVSCSCLPPPASLKPRKIYNLLVPDVFDGAGGPDAAAPISTSTQRKIGKLQEYVSANPGKAGKVSRRLSRRIKKALYEHTLGHVKVAVAAYRLLLDKSTVEDSSYSFSYFNKELIHQPDALISTLLAYQSDQRVQALGAQLLTSYIDAQSEAEHHHRACAELVGRVLKLLASPAVALPAPGARKDSSPPSAAAKEAPTPVEELHASCLDVLQAYVLLCHKLKLLPDLLEQIESRLLDSLEPHIKQPAHATADEADGGGPTTPSASSSEGDGRQAAAILRSFKPFMQAASTARRVVGALLQWLDDKGRWENGVLVERLLRVVQDACGSVTYPLTSSLLRHAAAGPTLTPKQRAIVARLAVGQGSDYSLSAFNLAMLELPRMLVAAARHAPPASELAELQAAAAEVCVAMAHEVGDPAQVGEALATVLRGQLSNAARTTAAGAPPAASPVAGESATLQRHTLECAVAVARALHAQPPSSAQPSRAPGQPMGYTPLPASLLPALTAALSGSSQDAQPLELPALALSLAAALLAAAPGPIHDDRQAAQLLDLVAASGLGGGGGGGSGGGVSAVPLGPGALRDASGLVAAVLAAPRPPVLLQVARLGLQLCRRAEEAPEVPQPLAALAVSCLRQLAGPNRSPGLASIQLETGEAGLLPPGTVFQETHTLAVTELQETAPSAAATGVTPAALAAWRTACVAALQTEGVLHTEYGASLPALLAKPALPGHRPASSVSSGALGDGGSTPAAARTPAHSSSAIFRSASIRRDQLDVSRVLDVLGHAGVQHGGPSSVGLHQHPPIAASAVPGGAKLPSAGLGGQAPAATLDAVLQLAAGLDGNDDTMSLNSSTGLPAADVSLPRLIAQLGAVH